MSDKVRVFLAEPQRVETGPIQFGDDWPGVFIRGDNALQYAMVLEQAVQCVSKKDQHEFMLQIMVLRGLVETLKSCMVK